MALVQTREVARFSRSCRRDGGVISFRQPGPIARSPASLPRYRRAYLHPPRSADRASESLPSAFRTPECNAVPTSEGSREPCRCPVQPSLATPVPKTQLKAQIPTNTQDHDFLVEVPTFEPFLDWYESRHLSITPELLVRLHQSPILHALFNDGQSGDGGVSEQVVLVGREFSRLTG